MHVQKYIKVIQNMHTGRLHWTMHYLCNYYEIKHIVPSFWACGYLDVWTVSVIHKMLCYGVGDYTIPL